MSTILRFVALGAAIFATLWAFSEWAAPPHALWRARQELLDRRGAEVEAIALGSSHNRAIDFEALGLRGLHLWHAGGDAFESRFVFEQSLPRLPALHTVFLTLSYPLLDTDNAIRTVVDRRDRRIEIYAQARTFTWIQGDFPLYLMARVSPLVRSDHWAGVARALLFDSSDPVVLGDGHALRPDSEPLQGPELERYGRRRAAQHQRVAAAMRAADPALEERVTSEIEALLRTASSRGIRVIAILPPYHPSYAGSYDTEAKERLRRVMRGLEEKYCGLQFVDYSEDPRWAGRQDLYINADHLSDEGARAFSTELRRRINAGARCGRVTQIEPMLKPLLAPIP